MAPDRFHDSLLSRALDGLCVGVVTVDPSGRVDWMNRAAQNTLGVEVCHAQGRPLGQLLRDPQLGAFWQQALETESTVAGHVTIRWPRETALRANATVARDTSGTLIGRALLFCDVTTERTVQVQLSQETTERLLGLAERWNEAAEAQAGLTPRELRILKFVGAGLSNPQIAAELGVAPSTVRSHLKHVYGKLGLTTRSEAISYALRHGLAQD